MAMLYDFEVGVAYNPARHAVDIYLTRRLSTGKWEYAEPIPPPIISDGGVGLEIRPFMTLDAHTVQKLMDALSQQGYKPDAQAKLEGELEATKRHLEDLRKLLFEGKGVNNHSTATDHLPPQEPPAHLIIDRGWIEYRDLYWLNELIKHMNQDGEILVDSLPGAKKVLLNEYWRRIRNPSLWERLKDALNG